MDWTFYGNELRVWVTAVAVALVVYVGLLLVRGLVVRQMVRISGRTATIIDDVATRTLEVTRGWALGALALWAGSLVLSLPTEAREIIRQVAILALLLQIGIWGMATIRGYVVLYGERRLDDDAASVMTVRALGFLGSVALWAIVVLVILENIGVDVTALIAGLGIGGIAVALAIQNILGDLFGSLSIVLDKPFVVGDFVVIDEFAGTIEHVGLKTTRVRSLSGEQLVFSNSDLLQSRIRNYKRMYERRVVFSFRVAYGTPHETIEWIPQQVREIIESLPDVRFDRAHFSGFGESSLDFEVVYYVLLSDYNVYMDRQQVINLELYSRLAAAGVDFGYPMRKVQIMEAGAEVSSDP